MAATPQQTDGLKLIGDWCKWLITVETAAIAAIGAFTKFSEGSHIFVQIPFTVAITSFVVSMLFAAGLLSAIPTAVTDMNDGDRIWDRLIYGRTTKGVMPFSVAAFCLFALFTLGVAAFGLAVIVLAWTSA